jgi:hypothetical protein
MHLFGFARLCFCINPGINQSNELDCLADVIITCGNDPGSNQVR